MTETSPLGRLSSQAPVVSMALFWDQSYQDSISLWPPCPQDGGGGFPGWEEHGGNDLTLARQSRAINSPVFCSYSVLATSWQQVMHWDSLSQSLASPQSRWSHPSSHHLGDLEAVTDRNCSLWHSEFKQLKRHIQQISDMFEDHHLLSTSELNPCFIFYFSYLFLV